MILSGSLDNANKPGTYERQHSVGRHRFRLDDFLGRELERSRDSENRIRCGGQSAGAFYTPAETGEQCVLAIRPKRTYWSGILGAGQNDG